MLWYLTGTWILAKSFLFTSSFLLNLKHLWNLCELIVAPVMSVVVFTDISSFYPRSWSLLHSVFQLFIVSVHNYCSLNCNYLVCFILYITPSTPYLWLLCFFIQMSSSSLTICIKLPVSADITLLVFLGSWKLWRKTYQVNWKSSVLCEYIIWSN